MLELPVPQRPLAELRKALSEGPVVLAARSRGLGEAALRELAGERATVVVDARLAGTPGGLRIDLARALLAHMLDQDEIEEPAALDTAARLAVARAFGARSEDVLRLAAGSPQAAVSLDDLLAAIPGTALLAVHDAHLLTESPAGRALWALRASAGESPSPWMLLLTRPWQTSLTERDAAFFGFARRIELPAPTHADWDRALTEASQRVGHDELRWLLDQTLGHPETTLQALERDADDLRSGWLACVAARRAVLDLTLDAARAAHPLGPRLIAAIARGHAPYPAVPDARPARVAHALRRLRDHDLAYQPAPRAWRLTDPALAEALRRRTVKPRTAAALR